MYVIPASYLLSAQTQASSRKALIQLRNRLIDKTLNLHIRNNGMSPVDLLLNLLEIVSDARSPPLIAVT